MSHVRMRYVLLGLLASLSALVLASSAAALPEFGQCFKKGAGSKYTNSVCTTKSTTKTPGEFEWRKATEIEAAKRKLEGTGGPVVLMANFRLCEPSENVRAQKCHEGEEEVTTGPFRELECESETDTGEISSTTGEKNVDITLRGCIGLPAKCETGATAGEVKLNALKGKLGMINKKAAPPEAGLVLEPAKAKGKVVTYTCESSIAFAVGVGDEAEGCVYPLKACGGDGVIAAVTPVNTMMAEFTQAFSANETFENVPSKFEGTQPLKQLETYFYNSGGPGTSMWSKASLSLTTTEKAPEAIEIKATA